MLPLLRRLLRVRCATTRGYRAIPPHRTIQTLNPDLLAPSDFLDLSELKYPTLHVQSGASVRLLYRHMRSIYIPFPSNARGFLYWHRPPSLPPIAAEIRFRITPEPNPNLFSTGADLLYVNDLKPWGISLAQIAKFQNYAPFKAQVTSDGLIDRAFMDSLELAWEGYIPQYSHTPTLFTLTQPFEINLKNTNTAISILTPRAQGRMYLEYLFRDHRSGSIHYPYAGRVLVQFETSPLSKHARPASRPPVLVLRVLKVLAPIETVPGYDMYLPMPAEGGLLSKGRTGPMTFDLEKSRKGTKDLRLLVE